MSRSPLVLDAAERVEGRPFTEPELTLADADVMRQTLALQRRLVRDWLAEGRSGLQFVRDRDAEGRYHGLSVPNVERLVGARDLTAVGFFGQAKEGVDHAVLFDLEDEITRKAFPDLGESGLLSHYDVEVDGGRFGNLVLFATPEVPRAFGQSQLHNFAVRISPRHYDSIRLHKGTVPGGFLGEGELAIERTHYLAYEPDGVWRAVRTF